MSTEIESNIRSLEDFRRRGRIGRLHGELDTPEKLAYMVRWLETEVARLEDVGRFLLRRDDNWSTLIAQMQRDVNYLLSRGQ